MECKACQLHTTRRCITKGIGCTLGVIMPRPPVAHYDILFLLEGPSASGELFGITQSKIEMKFIEQMVKDASEFYSLPTPSYYVSSAVLCRATDDKRLPNRAPVKDEVLSCMSNVMQIVNGISPRKIIFMSRLVEKYYRKEFKNTAFILPPDFLIKQGGPGSSWYPQSFRTLADVILKLQDERS